VPFAVHAQVNNGNSQLIKGRWISAEDKKYSVVFIDSLKMDYYKNEITSKFRYRISSDSLITEDIQTKEIYRYAIMGLSSKHLTLMYLDRGNLLTFSKAPQHM
jgi:hypothetical protein